MRSLLIVLTLLIGSSAALAQTRPARPARGGDAVNRLEKVRDAIQQLDLTGDQKEKVKAVFQELRDKLQGLRDGNADRAARAEKVKAIVEEMRTKLTAILTPEQQEKLRAVMSDAKPPTSAPATAPSKTGAADEKTDAAPAAERTPTLAAAGSIAPDFTLRRADGPNVTLSQFKGKIVLIVFGAYTSPTFRDHAAQLEQFRREYGNKLTELVIYTREPHATNDWEVDRNKDAGIAVAQAQAINDRAAAAKQMQSALKLTVPIVLDAIDNTTAGAYAAACDGAFLVGRDGTILTRQKWFEPYAMRRDIDAALSETKPAI